MRSGTAGCVCLKQNQPALLQHKLLSQNYLKTGKKEESLNIFSFLIFHL